MKIKLTLINAWTGYNMSKIKLKRCSVFNGRTWTMSMLGILIKFLRFRSSSNRFNPLSFCFIWRWNKNWNRVPLRIEMPFNGNANGVTIQNMIWVPLFSENTFANYEYMYTYWNRIKWWESYHPEIKIMDTNWNDISIKWTVASQFNIECVIKYSRITIDSIYFCLNEELIQFSTYRFKHCTLFYHLNFCSTNVIKIHFLSFLCALHTHTHIAHHYT